ncbi:MAG: hypothetical protein LC746_08195, partial [Acidobacteria bacterium]|nr:hypothetical protein [Acidobacteriota bacterium]
PYDSLSFAPTFLTLTGQLPRPGDTTGASFAHQTSPYPGRVITELFTTSPPRAPITPSPSGDRIGTEVKH